MLTHIGLPQIMVILLSAITVICSSPAIAGYQLDPLVWGDSPETVISKIKAAGWGDAKINMDDSYKKPTLLPLASIMDSSIDSEMNARLRSVLDKSGVRMGQVDLSNPGNVPLVYRVVLKDSKSNMLHGGQFFFNLDRQLMAYFVTPKESCSGKEADARIDRKPGQPVPASYSLMYRTLEEKYGTPERSLGAYERWKSDGVYMYYSCNGPIRMSYVNQKMVDAFIEKVQGGAARAAMAVEQEKAKALSSELSASGLGYGALSWNDTLSSFKASIAGSSSPGGAQLRISNPNVKKASVRLPKTVYDKGAFGADIKLWLRESPDTTGISDEALLSSDKYQEVELRGENGSVVVKAYLYFSEITGKLVVYRLYLKDSCNEGECENIRKRFTNPALPKNSPYSASYDALAQKLGGDAVPESDMSVKWVKGGETVYYVCYGPGTHTMLVFANIAGIDEHYDTFKSKIQQHRDKMGPQKASDLKKTF